MIKNINKTVRLMIYIESFEYSLNNLLEIESRFLHRLIIECLISEVCPIEILKDKLSEIGINLYYSKIACMFDLTHMNEYLNTSAIYDAVIEYSSKDFAEKLCRNLFKKYNSKLH